MGFRVVGTALSMEECSSGHPEAKASFSDNVAHSSLVGLLLEGSPGAECTGVRRFAAWRNWDFGVLAGLQGISTSVLLEEVSAVENKHAGILILKKGHTTEDHEANILGGTIQVSLTSGAILARPPLGVHTDPSVSVCPRSGLASSFLSAPIYSSVASPLRPVLTLACCLLSACSCLPIPTADPRCNCPGRS